MTIAIVRPAASPWPRLSTGASRQWIARLLLVVAITLIGALVTASGTPAAAPLRIVVPPASEGAGQATHVPPPWIVTPRVGAPAAPLPGPKDAVPAPHATAPLWQRLEASYELDVRLAVRTGAADIVETLDVRNPTDERLAKLDLSVLTGATGEFRLASVSRDGRAVPTRWTNNANLEVDLDPALVASSTRLV